MLFSKNEKNEDKIKTIINELVQESGKSGLNTSAEKVRIDGKEE